MMMDEKVQYIWRKLCFWQVLGIVCVILIILLIVAFLLWWFLDYSKKTKEKDNSIGLENNNVQGQPVKCCTDKSQCPKGACGQFNASPHSPLVCCESGKSTSFFGKQVCLGLPLGEVCGADFMCQSNKCQGPTGSKVGNCV